MFFDELVFAVKELVVYNFGLMRSSLIYDDSDWHADGVFVDIHQFHELVKPFLVT